MPKQNPRDPRAKELSAAPSARIWALVWVSLLLAAHPVWSPATAQDACAAVKEFGLEAIESAKSVVEQCKAEESTRRSRGTAEKSTGGDTEEMPSPEDEIARSYSRSTKRPRAIYGQDDRMEAEEAEVAGFPHADALRKAIRATAILSLKSDLQPSGGGQLLALSDYRVKANPFGRVPLCRGERFDLQKTGGYCTAFLVAPDLVATAGHCVNWVDVDSRNLARNKMAVVFGFEVRNGKERDQITTDEIYDVINIREISKPDTLGRMPDFALLQLDRRVPTSIAEPLRLAGHVGMSLIEDTTRLILIGHPSGLPKKVSLNPNSKAMQLGVGPIFRAQLNSFHGNSGSPVLFRDAPDVVAGILVNGQSDFEVDPRGPDGKGPCVRTQIYQADQLCDGERCSEGVTKSAEIEPYVP